jgi:hypothetical protein
MARVTHYTTLRPTGDRPIIAPAKMLAWIEEARVNGRPATISKDGVRFHYDDGASIFWWPVRKST